MNSNIRPAYLSLIILQAIHSVEEFMLRFYEQFPPMRLIYQDAPHLAKPAFAVSNVFLFFIGLVCFYYWVRPARRGAGTVVWIWIAIESFNVIAHSVWAVLTRGYNPGLATVFLFVPLLVWLWHSMRSASSAAAAEQVGRADRG